MPSLDRYTGMDAPMHAAEAAMTGPGTDSEALRALMARYELPLLRYAYRFVGDSERAQDVVQDTFLRFCQADPRPPEPGLAAWLYTVCRNRALDVVKKERRMNAMALDDAAPLLASPEPGPEASAAVAGEHAELLRMLAALPPKQQEVVRLKFLDGLSYKEISAVTGTSVGNVGFLLHTALKSLRQQLGGAGPVPAAERSAS